MLDDISCHIKLVDQRLKELAPEHIQGLKRVLDASGKRWRPGLVITIAAQSGQDINDQVINAATAIELIHLASLIHDDVMDSGTIRHGIPTINAEEGSESAILAGDYLIAKGCLLAYKAGPQAGEVVAETVAVLCEGQAKELEDGFNVNRTEDSLLAAIKGKTSSMFVASCKLGGIVAGLDAKNIELLTEYGENLGYAYQYADDVNDLVESPESAGKSVGIDIREGKYTLPVILSMAGPNASALSELLNNSETPTEKIVAILEEDDSIEATLSRVEDYKNRARKALGQLDNQVLAGSLEQFLIKF